MTRGEGLHRDYLQNGRGKLLVVPYCVRALPGAPVSIPLRWNEVGPGLVIREHTIRTVPGRALGDDPLLPILKEKPDRMAALERIQGRV